MIDPVPKLGRLIDALCASVLEASDAEILDEAAAGGLASAEVAGEVRALLTRQDDAAEDDAFERLCATTPLRHPWQ